jgi:predicted RNA binding protein YcfA (HicA-like mRNA interferase family)
MSRRGSHLKLRHPNKPTQIIFPYHANQEIGKGMEKRIKKDAGL